MIGQRFPGSCEGSFAISRLSGRSALSLSRGAACSCAVRRLVPAAACGSFKPLTTAPALFSVMCAASTAAFLCATFLLFFCGSFRLGPHRPPPPVSVAAFGFCLFLESSVPRGLCDALRGPPVSSRWPSDVLRDLCLSTCLLPEQLSPSPPSQPPRLPSGRGLCGGAGGPTAASPSGNGLRPVGLACEVPPPGSGPSPPGGCAVQHPGLLRPLLDVVQRYGFSGRLCLHHGPSNPFGPNPDQWRPSLPSEHTACCEHKCPAWVRGSQGSELAGSPFLSKPQATGPAGCPFPGRATSPQGRVRQALPPPVSREDSPSRLHRRRRREWRADYEPREAMNAARGAPWGAGCLSPRPHTPRGAVTGASAQPVLGAPLEGQVRGRGVREFCLPTSLSRPQQAPPGPPTPYRHDGRPLSPLQCDRPADASSKAGPGAGCRASAQRGLRKSL